MGEKKRNVRRFFDAGNTRCPICWRSLANRNDITVEHVPPKSIGGVKACLTCKACNNSFSEDEEYMRRDVEGADRMSLFSDEGRRLAAGDVVYESLPDKDGRRRHGFKIVSNPWLPDGIALSDATSMVFQLPTMEQLERAWIKSLYLMAGCARQGEAWATCWAPRVRSYLQGDIPLDDGIAWLDKNFKGKDIDPPTPPNGLVMRCGTAQRSDVFIAAWEKCACFFGLPKKQIPDDRILSVHWVELRPFVYGEHRTR